MNVIQLEENEKWINGYEGMYSVDSSGEVYSYKRKSKKALAGAVIYSNARNATTYRMVTLFKNGGQENFYYHRLVATAFVPNPEGKKEVNHVDGDKLNNHMENLEWSTRSENTQHAYDTGLMARREVSEDQWAERMDKFILTGDTGGLLSLYISSKITREVLHKNHVPSEFVTVSKSHKTESSPLVVWNHYIDLFRLCDSELSLSQVAKIVDMDHSMISYLRSGKRGKRARKVYDKYKDDPYYFVNYKPVYKYYI